MVTAQHPSQVPDPGQQPNLDPAPGTSGGGMIRSEEQLQVDTATYATERVRVGKHVITEEKTITVSVRREVFTLERVPVTDSDAPSDGRALDAGSSQTEYEMVLHEEQIVVQKAVVPVERVTLIKDVVTAQQDVTDKVRAERIETGTTSANDSTHPRDQKP